MQAARSAGHARPPGGLLGRAGFRARVREKPSSHALRASRAKSARNPEISRIRKNKRGENEERKNGCSHISLLWKRLSMRVGPRFGRRVDGYGNVTCALLRFHRNVLPCVFLQDSNLPRIEISNSVSVNLRSLLYFRSAEGRRGLLLRHASEGQ